MLRILLVIVICFVVYKYVDFEEHFDNTKPIIKVFQQIKNQNVLIKEKQTIKTSLNEKKGLIISIEDKDSNLNSVELFFKNNSTNNNYLRFYNKFKISKNKIEINLNDTILNKSLFGTHLTNIKIVVSDNSFKQNKHSIDFNISNNFELPFFEIISQSFEPFIPFNTSWVQIKTNDIEINDIFSENGDIIFNKISKNNYGILFLNKKNNVYDLTITDIYGNKYSKSISFLKLKKTIPTIKENNCSSVFRELNIIDKNKRINDFSKKITYKKGHILTKSIGLVKGKCNNIPYIIYSTNLKDINFLSFGVNEKNASQVIDIDVDLKGNNFINDYILYKNDLYDVNSFVKSYMNIISK